MAEIGEFNEDDQWKESCDDGKVFCLTEFACFCGRMVSFGNGDGG
jgi:hypothetical protein